MRRFEPDPEEKKRFEEWDKGVDAQRRQNKRKYYEDAIRRIREEKPGPEELEQWQNYLLNNNRYKYEQNLAQLRQLIERDNVNIADLTQRVKLLSDRYQKIGGSDILGEITRTAEYVGSLKERVERYRADYYRYVNKINLLYPNTAAGMLRYFEENKEYEAIRLGQKYFSVIGRAL